MATALQEDGKEYIRSNEQLAIRWCSIEVVREGKYSVQSDVWAFGVLAYEVFGCGVLPYSIQFDNLTEVSSYIKEGGKLSRPNAKACPQEVFDQLMLPCFAADPVDRPSFGALYDVAVKHGAEEDDEALAERAARRKQELASAQTAAAVEDAEVDRALLGPSVHHLKAALVPGMLKALEPRWLTELPQAAVNKLLMKAGVDGGFLVRPSAKGSAEVVLARFDEGTRKINDHRIEAGDGEVWLQQWHRQRFANVHALVDHHTEPGGDRKLGDRVAVDGYDCIGTVQFVGDHKSEAEPQVGVELDEAVGENNGTVDGHGYFNCPPKCGVLVQPQKVRDAEIFTPALVTIPGYSAAAAPAYSYASLLPGGDMAAASIWNMVHAYAKPCSAETQCPRDGETGCAYVDTLAHADDVGKADALLSYSWGYVVVEVSAALSAWAERTDRDPKRTRIWICSLCLNQHRMSSEVATPEQLAKAFGDRVTALGRILPMLEPWDDPGYVKRAWCLFELYTSIQNRQKVEIDIILSPSQAQSFRDRINADGTDAHAIDGALRGIKSENADASVQADLDAIRALIQKYSGGFGKQGSHAPWSSCSSPACSA